MVTPENFARQAVSSLGVVRVTSGCFNHEIQMLIRHLFPWPVLKYLIMPIYYIQRRRVNHLRAERQAAASKFSEINNNAGNGGVGVESEKTKLAGDNAECNGVDAVEAPTPTQRRVSRIPTSQSGGGGANAGPVGSGTPRSRA